MANDVESGKRYRKWMRENSVFQQICVARDGTDMHSLMFSCTHMFVSHLAQAHSHACVRHRQHFIQFNRLLVPAQLSHISVRTDSEDKHLQYIKLNVAGVFSRRMATATTTISQHRQQMNKYRGNGPNMIEQSLRLYWIDVCVCGSVRVCEHKPTMDSAPSQPGSPCWLCC